MLQEILTETAITQIVPIRIENKICILKCKICNEKLFWHNRDLGDTFLYSKEKLYEMVKTILIKHILREHIPELKIIKEKQYLKMKNKSKIRRILHTPVMTDHNIEELWEDVYKYFISQEGNIFTCNNCHRKFEKKSYSIRHYQQKHEIRLDDAPEEITQKTYENPWDDPESMYCDSDFLSEYTGKTIKRNKKCSDKKQ